MAIHGLQQLSILDVQQSAFVAVANNLTNIAEHLKKYFNEFTWWWIIVEII